MARIYSIKPPNIVDLELNKEIVRIGRLPDNDIVINDALISRRHCELRQEGERWKICDLGSLNGVFVNNLKVQEEFIASGDIILVGNVQFIFEEKAQAQVGAKTGFERELVKPVKELEEELILNREVRSDYENAIRDRESRYFYILYQIARALNSTNRLEELLDLSLELVFQVINAERGVILLKDNDERLKLCSARVKDRGKVEDLEIPVSRTIAERAIKERAGIITSDAQYDPRFKSGASIVAYNIRSALCVPIWEREEIQGVIYLDNLMQSYAFNEDDLKLLTAIANQVALAIRQEELQERMREEAIFRANLSRFHSPAVVNQMIEHLKQKKNLREQVSSREVTVLFCDICGFTGLSERIGPETLAQILNDYFNVMSQIIFEHKGTVDKFIGDALMAIFGAPISYGNDPELAVRASIAMLEKMEELRSGLEESQRFQVRIGINTGTVVAGYFGSDQRIEYTVLGDAVNVASRLQAMAPPGSIWIGENTYQKIKGLFRVKELDTLPLRGKKQKIRIYRVISGKGTDPELNQHLVPPDLDQ